MSEQDPLIKPGRPRIEVDYALVLHLRDEEHLGWTRGTAEYRKRTGQWISRDTFKRRYYEAKDVPEPKSIKVVEPQVIVKSRLERFTEEWEQKLKEL